ncbi:hypothetical protein PAMP_015196 [Pampus punctatissimus]
MSRGKAFVHGRNAHKTERNTVWSESGCYTRLKKAMATQAEGLPDHIALIQYSNSGLRDKSA